MIYLMTILGFMSLILGTWQGAINKEQTNKKNTESQVQVIAKEKDSQANTQGKQEVGNKICPVSGEEVGTMGEVVKYEHKGKVYNFCCKMCVKDFKKDPQKFIKKVEEEMKKGESASPENKDAHHEHKH